MPFLNQLPQLTNTEKINKFLSYKKKKFLSYKSFVLQMIYIKKNMYIHMYDYFRNVFIAYFIPKKGNESYKLDKGVQKATK